MTSRWLLPTVCAAALLSTQLIAPERASASPLFEVIGGENGGGMNARFASPGVPSAHFNPALLTRVPRRLSFGFFMVQDSVSMSLMGRSDVDVPLSILDAYSPDLSGFDTPTFPTDWVENGCSPATGRCQRNLAARPRQGGADGSSAQPYASIGLVHPLFGRRLVMGAYILVPMGNFTGGSQFFSDEREQFFTNSLHPELLSDRLSAPSVAIALAGELFDGFTVGVGVGIRLRTTAAAQTFVADGNDQSGSLELSTDIEVSINVAPYASLAYEFGEDAGTITATVHSPNQFEVGVDIGTILADGDNQTATRTAILDYMPWQFGLGGEIVLPSRESLRVSLTGGAVYRTWSGYVDRQNDHPTGDYAWLNTITPSIGTRLTWERFKAGMDLSYEPTPIPLQTGRTNYVDNDRIGGAASISRSFDLWGRTLNVGLQSHLRRLMPREQAKLTPDTTPGASNPGLVIDEFPDDAIDTRFQEPVAEAAGLQTNNPGWPGFGSEGWLWGGGLTLEFLY